MYQWRVPVGMYQGRVPGACTRGVYQGRVPGACTSGYVPGACTRGGSRVVWASKSSGDDHLEAARPEWQSLALRI